MTATVYCPAGRLDGSEASISLGSTNVAGSAPTFDNATCVCGVKFAPIISSVLPVPLVICVGAVCEIVICCGGCSGVSCACAIIPPTAISSPTTTAHFVQLCDFMFPSCVRELIVNDTPISQL